jgi:hypothetical protein
MENAYAEAYQHAVSDGGDGAYPLGNQIAAEIVLSWEKNSSKEDGKAIAKALDTFDIAAGAIAGSSTETWNLSAAAESRLMRVLATGKLNDTVCKEIEQKYLDALSRGASARKRDSMRTQFHFFRAMAETEFPARDRKNAVERLKCLEAKILG